MARWTRSSSASPVTCGTPAAPISTRRMAMPTTRSSIPRDPFDPAETENPRVLVPLYGAGLDDGGERLNSGEYDDYLHCLDVTGITAAGMRALVRTGGYDQNPIGPFASEGESFLALHQEFAFCAEWTLADQTRPSPRPGDLVRRGSGGGAGRSRHVHRREQHRQQQPQRLASAKNQLVVQSGARAIRSPAGGWGGDPGTAARVGRAIAGSQDARYRVPFRAGRSADAGMEQGDAGTRCQAVERMGKHGEQDHGPGFLGGGQIDIRR